MIELFNRVIFIEIRHIKRLGYRHIKRLGYHHIVGKIYDISVITDLLHDLE